MRLAFVTGCALLVACGGGGNVDVSANQDNFCTEIAEVACHNFYQCCSEGEIEDLLGVSEPRTEGQCRDDLELFCARGMGNSLLDSIKEGRVTFDSARMNDCLNSLIAPEDSCATVVDAVPWKEACMETAFVGTVATGGNCFFSHDCAGAPDSFCGPKQKCEQKPTAGFPCGTGCASQFFCGPSGTCVAKGAMGAPCTSADSCQKDLYCDFVTNPSMPVCSTKVPGGSACTGNDSCASGTCIPGRCMGTNSICYTDTNCGSHCANSTLSCTTSSQCSSGTCSVGGNTCTSDLSCTSGTGDMCVFPVLCVPGDCVGDPVCTAAITTVDYCDGFVSSLPVL
jgi:hypothetical protein